MKVKDVLILASSLLEREDLEQEFREKTEGFSAEAEKLLATT